MPTLTDNLLAKIAPHRLFSVNRSAKIYGRRANRWRRVAGRAKKGSPTERVAQAQYDDFMYRAKANRKFLDEQGRYRIAAGTTGAQLPSFLKSADSELAKVREWDEKTQRYVWRIRRPNRKKKIASDMDDELPVRNQRRIQESMNINARRRRVFRIMDAMRRDASVNDPSAMYTRLNYGRRLGLSKPVRRSTTRLPKAHTSIRAKPQSMVARSRQDYLNAQQRRKNELKTIRIKNLGDRLGRSTREQQLINRYERMGHKKWLDSDVPDQKGITNRHYINMVGERYPKNRRLRVALSRKSTIDRSPSKLERNTMKEAFMTHGEDVARDMHQYRPKPGGKANQIRTRNALLRDSKLYTWRNMLGASNLKRSRRRGEVFVRNGGLLGGRWIKKRLEASLRKRLVSSYYMRD